MAGLMVTTPRFAWTDASVEQLTRLVHEGRTASQIAWELGQGVTRNAVIGKVNRLGLVLGVARTATRAAKAAKTAPPTAEVEPEPAPPVPVEASVPPMPPPRVRPVPVVPAEPIQVEPIPFMHARDGQCRFSIDLPAHPAADMLVCGDRVIPGLSWCAACAARVFNRPNLAIPKLRNMPR